MEYGSGHDAGIAGGPDRRLEGGKEARYSWTYSRPGLLISRLAVNSTVDHAPSQEQRRAISLPVPGHFPSGPQELISNCPIMGWLSLHAPAE